MLRDYQQRCVTAIVNAARGGQRRQLASLPPGAGKTHIFVHLAQMASKRVLILAHRHELLTQPFDKLTEAGVDPKNIGIIKAQRDEVDRKYVIASVQTLSRRQRLERIRPEDFSLLVVDEAHHAAADSYRRVIDYVDARLTLGVTATPFRADKQGLDDLFGPKPVFTYPLRQALDDGWLVQPRQFLIRTDVDLNGVRTHAGDFAAGDLSERIDCESRNQLVVESWQKLGYGRPTVVFGVTVAHCRSLTDTFTAYGFAAETLSANTPDDKRAEVIRDLGAGEIDAVVNCGILTEGTDIPPLSCIVLARPTKSLGLYTQMIGRVLRPSPGKADALILDVADNAHRHKLVTVNTLLGVETTDFEGRTINEVERDERERKERTAIESWSSWSAKEVAIFSPIVLEGYSPTERWHDHSASDGQIKQLARLKVDLAGYEPTKGEASFLIDKRMAQRSQGPPTGKQQWYLRNHGVDPSGLSFDEASGLIREMKGMVA